MSSAHQVISLRTCIAVFLALIIGTVLTVVVASYDFGALNTAVAMAVACTKATFVIWYFMGVRWNTSLTKVAVLSGFVWLLIMFGLTMSDYVTRPWLGVLGR
jgi:cytochrome c oxidase subunit 4